MHRPKAQFIRYQLLLLLVFTTLSFTVKGQSLVLTPTQSQYTYLFAVPNATLEKFQDDWFSAGNTDLDAILAQAPLDSFLTGKIYQKELPFGNYLFVWAEKAYLKYRLHKVHSFEICLLDNKRDLQIVVIDRKTGASISDAEIRLDEEVLTYDFNLKAFRIKRNNQQGQLVVKRGEELAYYALSRKRNNPLILQMGKKVYGSWPVRTLTYPGRRVYSAVEHVTKRRGYWHRELLYLLKTPLLPFYPRRKGYLVLDQPMYQPGDTVRWKAYLVNRKKWPVRNKARLVLYKGRYGTSNPVFEETVKPSKGSFSGWFVVGDSLQIDRSYKLAIVAPRKQWTWTSNLFRLEDYQLDETHYTMRVENENNYAGEPVTLFLSGKDANKKNLLDARVSLEVKRSNIQHIQGNEVFLPEVIWEHKQPLDPLGETKITIPDSLFPDAEVDYQVVASFNNSNNETHKETKSLVFHPQKGHFKLDMEGPHVKGEWWESNQSKKAEAWLIGMYIGDTVLKEQVTLPVQRSIHPLVDVYHLQNQSTKASISTYKAGSLVEVVAYRKGDSVHVKLHNPRALAVRFNLFKNEHQEVESRIVNQLDTTWHAPGLTTYFFSYQYVWGGDALSKEQAIYRFEKSLKVELQSPKEVYPGQSTAIKVKVSDHRNRPAKGVEVSAGATNNQFKNQKLPNLPYLGKGKKRRELRNGFNLNAHLSTHSLLLTPAWRNQLQLNSLLHYQMRYPENGWMHYEQPIDSGPAQFSVHLVKNGWFQPVHLIYLDNELVYNEQTNKNSAYAILASPGVHSLKVRTEEAEYHVQEVTFKSGTKHDMVIDVEHLPSHVRRVEKTPELSKAELRAIQQSTITVYNSYYQTTAYIWQGQEFWPVRGGRYRTIGPMRLDSIHFDLPGQFEITTELDGGFNYEFKPQLVKLSPDNRFSQKIHLGWFTPKLMGETKVVRYQMDWTPKKAPKRNVEPWSWKELAYSGPRGDYRFEYAGDSTIAKAVLMGYDSLMSPLFRNTNEGQYRSLPIGYYQLILVSTGGHYARVDSIQVRANGVFFQRFTDENQSALRTEATKVLKQVKWATTIPEQSRQQLLDELDGGSVSGKLTQEHDGEPIAFASVLVNGGPVGVVSDLEGHFLISNLPPGTYYLEASSIGFESQKIAGVVVQEHKNTYLNIELTPWRNKLNEIEVIQYSMPLIMKDNTASSGRLATSVSVVHQKNIQVLPALAGEADIAQYLDVLPGVVFTGTDAIGPEEAALEVESEEDQAPKGSFNTLRTNFKDHAYWEPNLRTDANGEAEFEVTYPDDITSWRNYALAMHGRKGTGSALTLTKSYKNLVAQLATPRFLIVGDSTQLIGKALNYEKESIALATSFSINDESPIWNDTTLVNSVIEYQLLSPQNNDEISVTYQLRKADGYGDGEQRSIPVLPVGAELTEGLFAALALDSTLAISVNPQHGPLKVYASTNSTDFLLSELDQLKRYPYACMEQTASKLWAFLLEEKIHKTMGTKVNHARDIRKLIQRLEDNRKADGSWGWWPNSSSNLWMTAYVVRVLHLAESMGYSSSKLDDSYFYLTMNLRRGTINQQLEMLETLSAVEYSFPYRNHIQRIEADSLSESQKWRVLSLRQQLDLPHSLAPLLKAHKRTLLGNVYWGPVGYGWYNNHVQQTLLAYQILERADSLHSMLPRIRSYFLEIRERQAWRNTVEAARILATILPGLMRESNTASEPAFLVMNDQKITDFPFERTLSATSGTVNLEKKGVGTMYLSATQKYWEPAPDSASNQFHVRTWLEVDGERIERLQAGQIAEMKVEVICDASSDYVMIRVPIPAGCSYASKQGRPLYYESHREKFRDKTALFCEYLPSGKHTFTVRLQPRFSGAYTVNPAQVEQMYFPTFFGRNGVKKVVVDPVAE